MNIIFGAGSNGHNFLKKTKIKINYFVDNDKNLWNKKINLIKCLKPSDLKKIKFTKIIIASPAIENIKSQLNDLKIDNTKIQVSPYLAENFDEIPKKKFLVSVNGMNGGIYELNLIRDKIKRVFKGSVRGIKKIKDRYLCADENLGLIILDKNFKIIKKKYLGYMSNPHCLDFDYEKNIIYLTVTSYDCIYKISYPSLKIIRKIYLSKKTKFDNHHINSIQYKNNFLYLTMFSFKGIWRKNVWKDGVLIELNEKNLKKKILKKNLYQPHSVQYTDGKLHICNSMKCEIILNLNKKIKFNGYTRGLLVKDKWLLVGISKVRRLESYKKTVEYISQDAGVVFLNLERKTSNFFKFPTTEIFEIIEK
tara:strand:- start:1322 stop:2413 length:1092 start_codon:yes stop_codon:yes gene_type:complete